MPTRASSPSRLGRSFGLVVRREREARGWTQGQLADHALLSRNQVSLIERGRTSPTIRAIERIAAALEKTPHALVRAAEELV